MIRFASWVRRGVAAGISTPDSTTGAFAQPNFQLSVILERDGEALPQIPGPQLPVLGPGSVTGIHATAILRTDPPPFATGFEENYLVQVELARPDLPWMFTPAGPGVSPNNRLRPWIALIVIDADPTRLAEGKPLPRITVHDDELPDLSDSWAWAHAQLSGDTPEERATPIKAVS